MTTKMARNMTENGQKYGQKMATNMPKKCGHKYGQKSRIQCKKFLFTWKSIAIFFRRLLVFLFFDNIF